MKMATKKGGPIRGQDLEPLGPGGLRHYGSVAHDLAGDLVLNPAHTVAPAGSVFVVDGPFLHREELVGAWDFSILLDVSFEVTARRMATRDGTIPDPQQAGMRRYVEAQKLYSESAAHTSELASSSTTLCSMPRAWSELGS